MEIKWKPVTNYSKGRFGFRPEAIVIHIAEGWLAGGYSWFNNPASQVSSHYMIGKNGEIWQFVSDEDTAWHAGGVSNASWSKLKAGINPNLYTIGIENEGFTGEGFTEAMYHSNAYLIATLSRKFGIPINRNTVIGHYEINSSTRANCPGKGVDFNRLIDLSKLLLEDPEMIEKLQKQITALSGEVENLKKIISQKDKEMEQQKKLFNELEKELKVKEEQVIIIENQNSKFRKEIKDLQKRLSDLNADLPVDSDTNSGSKSSGGLIGLLKRLFNGKNSSN